MTTHGLSALLAALEQLPPDREVVLATVIDTQGSSYRKPGARMLIDLAEHSLTGIVGGGCFDDDLIEHAREVAGSGRCKVAFYDMRADDDVLWGLGMGCNGAVRVLLQPVRAGHPIIELLSRLADPGGVVSTCLESGDCWEDSAEATPGLSHQDDREIYTAHIPPRFRLGIFGTGSDVIPLVQLADQLDWHVTLWDHRPGKAKPERFPLAAKIAAFEDFEVEDASRCHALLVMSHNFDADRRFLNAVAELGVPFIGSLGPAARRERLLEEMARVPDGFAARLVGPVGLDLGGDLPEEIALSVMSQLQAFRLSRSGQSLAGRADSGPGR
ncbi:MAG: XdhC family protein [Pseudomonadota bacterium]